MNKPLRVLMVEDSEDDAALLLHTLRREGYEVVYEVVDTPSAMRAALDRQEWDVVTSDHAMPHFSAPEALALAKELRPNLPFIILSGEMDLNLAVSLMKEGAHDFIQKRELPRIVPAIERELKEAESIIKRKQAEQALRENESIFRSLVAYMHDAMIILDWDGTILLANWAAARIIEYEAPEDLVGHNMVEYLHPDSLQKAAADLEAVKADKMGFLSEYQLCSLTGRHIWVESIGGKILFRQVTANLVCIRDITGRKQAEEELWKSEDRYRFLLRNTSDYVARYSLTGILLFGSDAMYHMIGYKPDEIIGTSGFNRIHPDDRPQVQDKLKDAIENGREHKVRYRTLCKDGGYKWVEMSAKVVHNDRTGQAEVVAVVRDISESKRTEEELRDSKEKLSLVMDGVPSLLAYVDAELRYVYVNKAYADWYGRSKADIIGKHIGDLLDEEVFGRAIPHYRMALSGNPATFENRTIDKNGQERFVSVSIVPHFRGETVQGFFSSIMDVTDRKEAEHELHESEERFRNLYQESPIPTFTWQKNGDDFILIDCNRAAIQITSGKVRKLLGNRAAELYKDRPKILNDMNLCFQERSVVRREVTSHNFAPGRYLSVHYAFIPPDLIIVHTEDQTERKRAELQLMEMERKFRTIADFTYDWENWIGVNGKPLWISPSVERISGYSISECMAMPDYPLAMIYPEDRGKVLAGMQKANEAPLNDIEVRIIKKDEVLSWVSVSTNPVFTEEGNSAGHRSSIRDITDRKRVEETLRETNETLGTLIQSSPLAIIALDPEGNVTRWNPAAEHMFGWSEREVLGRFLPIVSEDKRDENLKLRERVLRGEAFTNIEVRRCKKDGSPIDISISTAPLRDSQGRITGIMSVSTDITNRKRAEEALRESEERYRYFVEESFAGVYVVENGRFVFLNDNAASFANYTPAELIGKSSYSITHPDDIEKINEKSKKMLKGEETSPYEFRIVTKDGQIRWVMETVKSIQYGGKRAVLGNSMDITERKQTEEEKVKLQDQLIQSQKMESVARLAGGVAHDFNNMLGVILGHTEMALDQMASSDPLYDDLTEIRIAANRSADLTRQLLAYARKQTVAPKVLDINDIVAGMLKMLQRIIGEDIDLLWLPGFNLWPVNIDPSQIDQILANLCVNARDAIAGVGKVTIETGNITFDAAYCADNAGFVPGEYILLAVSDDGCGMSREILGKVYEPFFTTKEAGKGTGLGLSTVYGIVKQNNGFINVYSEPNQGTTFKIYLPRHIGKSKYARTTERREPVMRGKETVLIVEDELAILNLSKRMLEKQGYQVLTAATPGAAIRLAEEYTTEIHLLMTDVVMPEMNGRDLAKKLLSLNPNMKRLFMSGYTANVIAHHGVLDEGVFFIQKPFSIKDLAAKVREALDRE